MATCTAQRVPHRAAEGDSGPLLRSEFAFAFSPSSSSSLRRRFLAPAPDPQSRRVGSLEFYLVRPPGKADSNLTLVLKTLSHALAGLSYFFRRSMPAEPSQSLLRLAHLGYLNLPSIFQIMSRPMSMPSQVLQERSFKLRGASTLWMGGGMESRECPARITIVRFAHCSFLIFSLPLTIRLTWD